MKSRLALLGSVLLLCGSSSLDGTKSPSPEAAAAEDEKPIRTVGDLAVPYKVEMGLMEVEGVGLVSGLKGTGSDPKPSPQRDLLVTEMKARGVPSPNAILESGNYSLVMVRGLLRPGIQKGDSFDVEVRVPSQCETTSLRGGYLLPCSLRLQSVLQDAKFHTGFEEAVAEGPVMVDPSASNKKDKIERVLMTRGRILGGGRTLKSRTLKLVLKPEREFVEYSADREGNQQAVLSAGTRDQGRHGDGRDKAVPQPEAPSPL